MTKFSVQFTADVVTEESANVGDFARSGWIDPQFSKTVLFEAGGDVPSFKFDTREEAEEFIESHIGTADSFDGEDWYASDSHTDLESGENWSYHARIEEI